MSRTSENGFSFTDTVRAMARNQYFSLGEDTMSKRVQVSIAANKTGANLVTRKVDGQLRVYCVKPATVKRDPVKLYKLVNCKEIPARSGGSGRPVGSVNAAKPTKKAKNAPVKKAAKTPAKKAAKVPAKVAKKVAKPTPKKAAKVKNIKTHAAKLTPAN